MRPDRRIDCEGLDGVLAVRGPAHRAVDADGLDGVVRLPPAAVRFVDADGLDGVLLGAWLRAIPALVEVWATEAVEPAGPPEATPKERAAKIGLVVVRSGGERPAPDTEGCRPSSSSRHPSRRPRGCRSASWRSSRPR
ncbi:MAG: hypothetical protein R3F59_33805 [Myxococcota bacterium]